jgi:serine protease Do
MRDFFRFDLPDETDPEPFQARGEGSGFIFTEDGYIITNNHVIEDAAAVLVVMPDRRQFDAEVVGADPITDVAVLKIDAGRRLPKVDLGDSDAIDVGDAVLALGNPLDFDFTVTAGIVSAKGRGNLNIGPVQNNVRQMIQDFIQTDAAINRGNSGGPLVDLQGRVVGINTAIASQTGFYSGYGFAIPINLAKVIATDLIEHGEVQRSWLGITFNEITADWADAVGLDLEVPYGVVVQSVVEDGPADDAGLQEEDIILSIDGEPVEHSGKLQTVVSTKKPGTRIGVEVFRGGNTDEAGERRQLTIRLGERPPLASRPERRTEPMEAPELVDPLGLEVEELTRQERRDSGYRGDGVIIGSVEPGHPFSRIEPNPVGEAFLVDSIIVEIDGKPVKDLDSYLEIVGGLESGEAVLVRFYNPAGNDGDRYTTLAVRVP